MHEGRFMRLTEAEIAAIQDARLKGIALYDLRKQVSVQPEWCRVLSVQQQSVLLLAARGPDGIAKRHPCKPIHMAYRGSVLVAAKYGRPLVWGERADSFMSLDRIANRELWESDVDLFFAHHDALAHHYVKHLMHGVQILGYKHPDVRFRERWNALYLRMVEAMHLEPENEGSMDKRLGDWDRQHWDEVP